jgi:hypothetical protein
MLDLRKIFAAGEIGGGSDRCLSALDPKVMYWWTKRLRERVASLLHRVSGISTPFGGVTWRPSEAPPRRVAADVRVGLVGPARHARFVLLNVGDGTAHGVQFEIELADRQESPLIEGDCNEKLPSRYCAQATVLNCWLA